MRHCTSQVWQFLANAASSSGSLEPYVQSCSIPGLTLSQLLLTESETERGGPQNCAVCVLQAACLDVLKTTSQKEGFDSCLATGSSYGRRRSRILNVATHLALRPLRDCHRHSEARSYHAITEISAPALFLVRTNY